MPIAAEKEDGTEVQAFLPEEVDAKVAEAVAAAQAEGKTALEVKEAELAEMKRLNAERGENFTQYSKMTEEQKKAFDANTTNLLKREEALLTEVDSLKTTISKKEETERSASKNGALAAIHGGKEDVKKNLEEQYALLTGMPETTQEEINARASAAARLAGIQIDPRNPLYVPMNGEAPKYKENKEFVETPEGTQAADMVRGAMGLPNPKK